MTPSDPRLQLVHEHLRHSAEVSARTADTCGDAICRAADLIASALRAGGKLLICGNGGSAADAQHMATELVGRLTREFDRPGMAAVALTTDSSLLTALANDLGFDGVFARQVQALGRAGDVLVGISTSGSSRNVVNAVDTARRCGLGVICLTASQGVLSGLADVAIQVPSASTAHIQEAHLAVAHILCHLVERMIYPHPQ
jgi:D-sedoheptulose 7-phosphate isomerase